MNKNQPADVVGTESGHCHCEWNIRNLFLELIMLVKHGCGISIFKCADLMIARNGFYSLVDFAYRF